MKNSQPQKITIIGTGYVGLVSAAVFADWGNDVVCLDIDTKKIEDIKNGIMPIYEDGLKELVERVINEGKFTPTTDYKMAVEHGDIIFICVGTPSNQSGAADLRYVFSAAESISKYMKEDEYKIIVTKSTVPVGTNLAVAKKINDSSEGRKLSFDVASNPEFLREGSAIEDANHTDRVVIGSNSEKALNTLKSVYIHLDCPIVETDLASAELIKYASNAFLATKISFINEISQICERTGANVDYVSRGMGMDNRIGSKFLNAGIGYGGSCFPKDVEALFRTSNENYYDFRLLRGVMDANIRQKEYFMEKVWDKYGHSLDGMTIGVLGAAFKNNTDDTRKSVALDIIKILRGAGASIKLFDPAALEKAKQDLGSIGIEYCDDYTKVFDRSDCLFVLTEWKEFKDYDYSQLGNNMKSKVVFDGRNLLDPKTIKGLGFEYHSIGR